MTLPRAFRSGRIDIGGTSVDVHVLPGGAAIVEAATVEALLGLPESGLGAFLASLPGTDRVAFLRKDGARVVGVPAEKMSDMLISFWQANNGTPEGNRARDIVRAVVKRGMRASGHSEAPLDFLMAAATPPRPK